MHFPRKSRISRRTAARGDVCRTDIGVVVGTAAGRVVFARVESAELGRDPIVRVVRGGRRAHRRRVVDDLARIAQGGLLGPKVVRTLIRALVGAGSVVAVEELVARAVGRADGPDRGRGPEILGREPGVGGDRDRVGGNLHAVESGFAPLTQFVDRHAIGARHHAGQRGGAVLRQLAPILIALRRFLEVDPRLGQDDGVIRRVRTPSRGVRHGHLDRPAGGSAYISIGRQFRVGIKFNLIGGEPR